MLWSLLLIMNCLNLFFFRIWLGPKGIFYSSILLSLILLLLLINDLYLYMINNFYLYIDFGRWFFNLDIIDSHLLFIIDNLALLMAIVVVLLSIFAQYFGLEYMYREAYISRLLYLLNFFTTSVVFLFFIFDFFLILIIWELIGLFSLLLVNFYAIRVYTIKAALKTFIYSRISDSFIFCQFILIILIFNTSDLSILFIQIPFFIFYNIYVFTFGINILTFLSVLLVLASSIKAAQIIVHVWLPDAMEAPTPASALIHSSTLVIMGIFLIIRFNIIFEFSFLANLLMTIIGSLTIAFGAVVASFQNDIKKLVAFSTISQMGYLFCGCGFFCYTEVLFYLIIHAFNKAFLFIIVGYVVHYFNSNTDLRYMGSLIIYALDLIFILFIISLNLTGLPYSSGFIAKEFLIFQTFKNDLINLIVRSCWFISFFFTPFYMLWLNLNVFYYLKLNTVGFYKSLLISNQTLLYKFINLQLNLNFINSNLTIFILFVFFWIILLSSEFLLLILFNFNSIFNIINCASWSYFNIFFFNCNLIFSSLSLTFLSYFIFYIVFFTCRFFFLIKWINSFY